MKDRTYPPNYTQEQKDYIESHHKRADFYYEQARTYWFLHHFFQVISLVGASSIPYLLIITEVPKLVPTIISAIVALSTAFVTYYRFLDRSQGLFSTSADMTRELRKFHMCVGAYKELSSEQAFDLLMKQLDTLTQTQYQRTFSFPQVKSVQVE
jgi:Protein of unknown function (DUF4231)